MKREIKLGSGIAIELLVSGKGEWEGIGKVAAGKTPLRDSSRPWALRIDTPEGLLYTRFMLKRVKQTKDGADVELSALALPWGRQEYCDEYFQPLMAVNHGFEPLEDSVTIHFRPVSEKLGGRDWRGFSYSIAYRSSQRQIHRLVCDSTWELGGSIAGNTVLSQGQCNMPAYHGAKNTVFTSACLKTLEQHGKPQGYSYQLGPRGGLLQAFDFQHGKAGALFQYWPKFEPVSSLIESPKGSTRLHVIDEYRFDLSKKAATTPQHVLFTPGPLAEHEARDLWWHAYERAYGLIQKAHKVEPTVVRPEKDLDAWPQMVNGELMAKLGENYYKPAEVMDGLAEEILPQYAKMGAKRAMVFPVSESDVTQYGTGSKLADQGVHGDWLCGSVCCTHRYLPADFWGGMKAFGKLADKAHKLGIELGVWTSPHLSPRSPIFNEHPDWLLRAQHTLTQGGGYYNCTAMLDWNSGVAEWILNDLLRWRKEGGLDYAFVDSWANLGFLCPNYADRMKGNLHPLGRFYGLLQKAGIKSVSFEGISPFGYSRFGIADLRRDKLAATQGIVGQNDFGWWRGQEDMAFNIAFHLVPRKRTEEEIADIRFRLLAARGGVLGGELWDARLAKIYERALPHMQTRRLLPNGAGISWTGGGAEVLWVFKKTSIALPRNAKVEVLEADSANHIETPGKLAATPMSVYRIGAKA